MEQNQENWGLGLGVNLKSAAPAHVTYVAKEKPSNVVLPRYLFFGHTGLLFPAALREDGKGMRKEDEERNTTGVIPQYSPLHSRLYSEPRGKPANGLEKRWKLNVILGSASQSGRFQPSRLSEDQATRYSSYPESISGLFMPRHRILGICGTGTRYMSILEE